MGRWQKQTELWVEPVNLGIRIPQDRLPRKINKVLDLGFVRGEVSDFYRNNGEKSPSLRRREKSRDPERDPVGSGAPVNRKLRSTTDPDSTVVRHQMVSRLPPTKTSVPLTIGESLWQ
jgi:hypothetical protein